MLRFYIFTPFLSEKFRVRATRAEHTRWMAIAVVHVAERQQILEFYKAHTRAAPPIIAPLATFKWHSIENSLCFRAIFCGGSATESVAFLVGFCISEPTPPW